MPLKKLLKNSLAAALLVSLCAACRQTTVYHFYHTFSSEGWNKSDTLVFTLSPTEVPAGTYALRVELRHTDRLSFGNLWMVVYQNEKDSTLFTGDTLQCRLTDEEGRYIGTGLGTYYQQSFPLKQVTLSPHYTTTFKIAHYMKKGRLEGITDVGIRLVEP